MSKQNSLDKYFLKRKENNETNTSAKKARVENENIIIQENIAPTETDHSIVNKSTTSNIDSSTNTSVTSRTH